MVSPVFTSGKLKLMVPHIDKCGVNIEDHLRTAAVTGEILEAKEMYGKFTLDSIATSGFGIESNSYKDPENLFRINAMKLVRFYFGFFRFILNNFFHSQRSEICYQVRRFEVSYSDDLSQNGKTSRDIFSGQGCITFLHEHCEEDYQEQKRDWSQKE